MRSCCRPSRDAPSLLQRRCLSDATPVTLRGLRLAPDDDRPAAHQVASAVSGVAGCDRASVRPGLYLPETSAAQPAESAEKRGLERPKRRRVPCEEPLGVVRDGRGVSPSESLAVTLREPAKG